MRDEEAGERAGRGGGAVLKYEFNFMLICIQGGVVIQKKME